MTIYMYIGLKAYHKIEVGFTPVKQLFVVEELAVVYMMVYEYNKQSIIGLYFLILASSFFMFCTLLIVMDNNITDKEYYALTPGAISRRAIRWIINILCAVLLWLNFRMHNCTEDKSYPHSFLWLLGVIVVQQIYDLALYFYNYGVDVDNMKEDRRHPIRFNKDIFLKQTKVLFYANIIFGLLALLTMVLGLVIVNHPNNNYIACTGGSVWVFKSIWGTLFGSVHQMLVLLQINTSQYVLVKIPRNHGCFDKNIRSELIPDDDFKNIDEEKENQKETVDETKNTEDDTDAFKKQENTVNS